MVVNVVTLHVQAGHVPEFIAATLKNHAGSRREPGNHRFDVLQSVEDPTRFTFYEVFASPEALEAHRRTSHYLEWKAEVEPWMAEPRVGRSHTIIAPTDSAAW